MTAGPAATFAQSLNRVRRSVAQSPSRDRPSDRLWYPYGAGYPLGKVVEASILWIWAAS